MCSEAEAEVPAYVSYTVSGPIGASVGGGGGDSPTTGSRAFGRRGRGLWPARSVDKKETAVKVGSYREDLPIKGFFC